MHELADSFLNTRHTVCAVAPPSNIFVQCFCACPSACPSVCVCPPWHSHLYLFNDYLCRQQQHIYLFSVDAARYPVVEDSNYITVSTCDKKTTTTTTANSHTDSSLCAFLLTLVAVSLSRLSLVVTPKPSDQQRKRQNTLPAFVWRMCVCAATSYTPRKLVKSCLSTIESSVVQKPNWLWSFRDLFGIARLFLSSDQLSSMICVGLEVTIESVCERERGGRTRFTYQLGMGRAVCVCTYTRQWDVCVGVWNLWTIIFNYIESLKDQ